MGMIKEMTVDTFDELIRGSYIEKFLAVLLVVLSVAAIVIVLWIGSFMYDSLYITLSIGEGEVVGRSYQPQSTTLMPIGKVLMPMTNPESFYLTIKLSSGEIGKVSVSKKYQDETPEGTRVSVSYGHGRLSGKVHIKKIETIN